MHSIQSRLATGLLFSLAILLLVQWVIISTSIHYLSEQYISTRLIHDADSIVAALNITPTPEELTLAEKQIDAIYNQAFSGHYFELHVNQKTLRSRSLWDETLSVQTSQLENTKISYLPGPQQQQLMVLTSSYRKQGQRIVLAVAEDISAIDRDIENFLLKHSLVSLFIFILLVLLQMLIIKRSLKPLEQVRKDLHKLEMGEIDALNETVPNELKPLVQELNLRLEAMTQRLKRSRHTAGNLAHALKGRLTLLTHALNSKTIQSDPELHKSLSKYINDLQQIIHQELTRARVAGAAMGARQAKLAPELDTLIKTVSSIYQKKQLTITRQIPTQATCYLEREDLHELLGNLLDNACKWANKKIHISVTENEQLCFIVEDDGPGCKSNELNALSTRGVRLDEQVTGYGLGLSIVKDIVNSYGGVILFEISASLGGLKVIACIPKTRPTSKTGNR